MESFAQKIDAITVEQLRVAGSIKWPSDGDLIGAFIAEMDFGIAQPITAALQGAIADGLHGYMPPHLARELQEATADNLCAKYHWTVSPSDVHAVPDVLIAFQMSIEHHSVPGSKIIVPTPAYMPFLFLPALFGREVIEVPMIRQGNRYGFDLDGLQRAFEDGGNLLVLCSPYNPLGTVFSREELRALSEVVDRNQGRVFADEIWAPIVYPGARHIPYASVNGVSANHSLTAVSASKGWNVPGLKCAQVVVSNDADREIWTRVGGFTAHATPNLGVVAAIAAYRDGAAWLEDATAYLDRNRRAISDLVAEHLPGVRYVQPEGTYIAWLDFRETPIAQDPALFMRLNAGVDLTDGRTCGAGHGGWVRLAFALPLPILRQAMQQMGRALRRA